jgi:hypothetical protein
MTKKRHSISIIKIKSFTLTEIIVASLMSAILISLVISVFSFLIGQIKKEKELMGSIEDTLMLERFLDINTLKCDSVSVDANQLRFYEKGYNYRTLDFNDNSILIHIGETIDTVHLVSSDLWYSRNSSGNKVISKVRFNIISGSMVIPVVISKEYEGVVLVNSNTINNEF